MFPIYEHGHGNGIGYDLDSFSSRFDAICSQQVIEGQARAFAFIFYDFTDTAIRSILNDQGVFAKLDRLSGKQLSVFYLDAGSGAAVARFNQHFLAEIGVSEQAELPCVVFFKVHCDQIEDVEIAQLDNARECISNCVSSHGVKSPTRRDPWPRRGNRIISTRLSRS